MRAISHLPCKLALAINCWPVTTELAFPRPWMERVGWGLSDSENLLQWKAGMAQTVYSSDQTSLYCWNQATTIESSRLEVSKMGNFIVGVSLSSSFQGLDCQCTVVQCTPAEQNLGLKMSNHEHGRSPIAPQKPSVSVITCDLSAVSPRGSHSYEAENKM